MIGVGFADFPIANTPELARNTSVTQAATGIANAGPHNIVIGTLAELGLVGLLLFAFFVAPLVVRRGWGSDAAVIQASLASLVIVAMFIDMSTRKELWLFIGLACGLSDVARRGADSRRPRSIRFGVPPRLEAPPPATP